LRRKRNSIGILILAVIFVAVLCAPSLVLAQQNDAASAISAAQKNLVQCYDAARAAEAASANISQLTLELNSAGLLLSRAELAYSTADFGSAQNLAAQSESGLANFVSDANALQTSAAQNRMFDFLLNVVGSIAGTIAVLVGSIVVWRRLKRKYEDSGVQKSESDPV
jgi:hypothetical protein